MRPVPLAAPLLCALALAAFVRAGDDPAPDPLVQRLRELSDADEVAPVASEALVRVAAGDARAGELLFAAARAWYRAGRAADSVGALERLAAFPDWSGLAWLGAAQVHLEQGQEDAAVAALRRATQAPPRDTRRDLMDASNTLNEAYEDLGRLLERRGAWAEALACWEAWEPRSWCGNCGESLGRGRRIAIARCRFHLGQVAEALAGLREFATTSQWEPYGAALYLELAARAGKLEEAGRHARAELAAPLQDDFEEYAHADLVRRLPVLLAIAEGLAARAPEAILAAVRPLDPESTKIYDDRSGGADCPWTTAARLLGELGAGELLRGRIARGDEHAIVLAGLSGLEELIPALLERLGPGERTGRVAEALERLGRPTLPPPRR